MPTDWRFKQGVDFCRRGSVVIPDNHLDGPIGDIYGSFMNLGAKSDWAFGQVKAIALAVSNAERARRFYGETLGLPLDKDHELEMAFLIGRTVLLLKRQEDWYAKPSDQLNPRITLEVKDAYATEKALRERGVTISDPVAVYGTNPIGAFLDSEGNKLWFCSDTAKS